MALDSSARPLVGDDAQRLAALSVMSGVSSGVSSGLLARDRSLPVHEVLRDVLPQGVTRGSTVGCSGTAGVSSALLMAAAASQAGAWLGVAGAAGLGLQACREAGVALERLVAVRDTPAFTDEVWGQVLATLIDGFDLVLFGAAARVRPATARRLQTRLQSRGALLLVVGAPGPFSCDVQLTATATWHGLGDGHGHLDSRRVDLTVEGRRIQRPRHDSLWFPSVRGQIEPAGIGGVARIDRGLLADAESPVEHDVAEALDAIDWPDAEPAAWTTAPQVDGRPGAIRPGDIGPAPLRRTG